MTHFMCLILVAIIVNLVSEILSSGKVVGAEEKFGISLVVFC